MAAAQGESWARLIASVAFHETWPDFVAATVLPLGDMVSFDPIPAPERATTEQEYEDLVAVLLTWRQTTAITAEGRLLGETTIRLFGDAAVAAWSGPSASGQARSGAAAGYGGADDPGMSDWPSIVLGERGGLGAWPDFSAPAYRPLGFLTTAEMLEANARVWMPPDGLKTGLVPVAFGAAAGKGLAGGNDWSRQSGQQAAAQGAPQPSSNQPTTHPQVISPYDPQQEVDQLYGAAAAANFNQVNALPGEQAAMVTIDGNSHKDYGDNAIGGTLNYHDEDGNSFNGAIRAGAFGVGYWIDGEARGSHYVGSAFADSVVYPQEFGPPAPPSAPADDVAPPPSGNLPFNPVAAVGVGASRPLPEAKVPLAPNTITGGSTYEQRLMQTPVNNGSWSGVRGESVFTSTHPDIVAAIGNQGIEYTSAFPNFSPVAHAEVVIENMTNNRDDNFRQADTALARQRGVTARDIAILRKQNGYTWHEVQDLRTMQLLDTAVNGRFRHLGGVGDINADAVLSPETGGSTAANILADVTEHMRFAGPFLLAAGVYQDARSLQGQVNQSIQSGDWNNTGRETARIAGAYAGGWVGAEIGASEGALLGAAWGLAGGPFAEISVPAGALIGGLVFGAIGYFGGGFEAQNAYGGRDAFGNIPNGR